jgi:low-affinity ferrous iron transport protein
MAFAQKDVFTVFRKIGEKPEVRGTAPTQIVYAKGKNLGDEEKNITGLTEKVKQRRLDRWLDKVVQVSGSYFVFFSILAALLTWAFLGIKFGRDVTWQVIISDAQAIICYIFDSFLCRQQLNAYEEDIEVAAQMQSRSESHLRMLSKLKDKSSPDEQEKVLTCLGQSLHISEGIASQLPSEDVFGRVITFVAFIIGHMVTILLFWAGIFAWIGIGHLFNYSDEWQLYMNSASSALMVFTFIFIANIGQRHFVYTKKCVDAFFLADSSLELRLRSLTNDVQSNIEVVIPAPKVGKIQRAIFYYADFVGTLVGIAILITVMVAWLAVGPAVKFSSNWWLFIGTYAGLIGMFDGFVLRNMQSRLRSYTNKAMRVVEQRDRLLFEIIGLPLPVTDSEEKISLTHRVSQTLDRATSHQFAVVAGFLTVVGLIVGSTVMGWSLTGQLLCNVPPSIIESFLMIVLITGHNSIEEKKRTELLILYERRLRLLDYVEKLQGLRNEAALCSKVEEAVVDTNLI